MKFFILSVTMVMLVSTANNSLAQVTVSGASILTPNGNFTSLNAAFSAINNTAQGGQNILVMVTGNTVESSSAILYQNPVPWVSFSIQPQGNVSVIGNLALPLIDFNGADNVVVDGLNSGGNNLTIQNSNINASASTIRFVNDATNNSVINCTIKGSGTGIPTNANDGAVIFMAGTSNASATGNDNILISDNDITSGPTLAYVLVKGYGNPNALNNNVSISNNLIHDFFSTVNSNCRGVYVSTGNADWIISSNRIYQTADRQWLSGGANVYSCIEINNPVFGSGNNFQINNNVLGFRNAGGTGYTVMKNGGTLGTNVASNIHAIILNNPGAFNNIISGNIIGGFDLKSSRGTGIAGENIFIGIFVRQGEANINQNVIGSPDISNSIIIRSTAAIAPAPVPAIGIYTRGSASQSIVNNKIGGVSMLFEVPGTPGSDRISFIGILTDNNITSAIRNNFIGGFNPGNINSSLTNARIVAIQCIGGISNATSKVTGNKIQNLSHTGLRTTFSGINSNLIGILISPGTVGDSIAKDTITDLLCSAVNVTGYKSIIGIYVEASTLMPGTKIVKNIISNLNTPGGPGNKVGVYLSTGNSTLVNNIISIGGGSSGNDIINGVEQIFNVSSQIYFNSIKISGTSLGSSLTSVIKVTGNSSFSSNVLSRNNIIYNDRQANSYGYNIGSFVNYSGDHNIVFGNPLGNYLGVPHASLSSWFAATGQDGPTQSLSGIVSFLSSTNLHTSDLLVRNGALSITGITDDIDNFTRGICPDIGADEFDPSIITGSEYMWIGTVNDLWCNTCNWDREIIPPANSNVTIKDNCLNYPFLQVGCGNQVIGNLTMLKNLNPLLSSQLDFGNYKITASGNINIEGICNCSGVTDLSIADAGLLELNSATIQQIVDIKNELGNYPGRLCKLKLNKTAPTMVAGSGHEALLKGNLLIDYHFDISNGVLLSQNGITYDANEATGDNFKTITILNDDPLSVTRQAIPSQDKRNGFFMGRLNRSIRQGTNVNEYIFPLGYRSQLGTGILNDYFYTPALVKFDSVATANFLVGTFLNSNSNGVVDNVNIGFAGHGCFNSLETDDLGGATAITCGGKEIDRIASDYWDFSENTGNLPSGEPNILAGALGVVNYDLQCSGDNYALTAVDGLAGSQLRLMNRNSVVIPGNTGQGQWISNVGNHSPVSITSNSGISMYSISGLEGAARSEVSQFGGFAAAGNGYSSLPVELIYFDAIRTNDGLIFCSWSTHSEINSDYFIVEVSDGLDNNGNFLFINLERVEAAGNSNTILNYSITDKIFRRGIVYYRLKQVDLDGSYWYSQPVAVPGNQISPSFEILNCYPNPVGAATVLNLAAPKETEINVECTDLTGRIISLTKYKISKGQNNFILFNHELPSAGIYFLTISDKLFYKKIIRIVIP